MIRPSDFSQCFQGVIPSAIATVDRRGIPNVTYVSQVYLIDDRHVARESRHVQQGYPREA